MTRPVLAAAALAAVALGTTPAGAAVGCAGFPSMPETYVCIESLDPFAALPGTSSGSTPVTVPGFCYVAGCTDDTTVYVPRPGATPGSGYVVTVSYQGQVVGVGVWSGLPPTNELVRLVVDSLPEGTTDFVGDTVRCVRDGRCD